MSYRMTRTNPGERRDIECDAFPMNADGCLGRVELGEAQLLPPRWIAAPDPFERVSRITGQTVILHLCPKCAAMPNTRAERRDLIGPGARPGE